jgi:hypothetical protein
LSGWQRIEGMLEVIEMMEGWISPRLGVRFELGETDLEIYRPDGQKFISYGELEAERELERLRTQQEAQRAEQEAQRAERLAAKLRELNIDPDSI